MEIVSGNISLSESLLAAVRNAAQAEYRSANDVIADAVTVYLEWQNWHLFVEANERRARANGLNESDLERLILDAVPGGGLSADHSHWISCKRRYRLSVEVLSPRFRRLFLKALDKVFRKGQLRFLAEMARLNTPHAFRQYLVPVRKADWVVYAKPPFGTGRERRASHFPVKRLPHQRQTAAVAQHDARCR